MSSGNTVYSAFTNERARLEREARGLSSAVHDKDGEVQKLVRRQAELWNRLASIQLESKIELPASVQKSLEKRNVKIDAKQGEIEAIKTRLSALKRNASTADSEIATLTRKLNDDIGAIRVRFDADERVVPVRAALSVLGQTRSERSELLKLAEAETVSKRVAYEEDEFFAYLQRRGYGTPQYSALIPLTKLWDGALAKATNYAEEKANYDRLLARPEWIEDSIAALDPAEEKAKSDFRALETEYFGALQPQEDEIKSKTSKLKDLNDAIERENRAIAEANRFLSDAALAEDVEIKQIVHDLSAILERQGLLDLKKLAAATETKEDDEIVEELQSSNARINALMADIKRTKASLLAVENKVSSFEQVERQFRSSDWNDSGHRFNGVNETTLASQLSNDALSAAMIISMLNSAHVAPRREETSYGSGYSSSSSSSSSSWGSSSSSSGSDSSWSTTSSDSGSSSWSTTDSV
jgi:chromosome segregation ATPase